MPITGSGSTIIIDSSAPLNPYQGQEYINSVDHKLYIYYGTTWQVLHQLDSISPVTGNPIGLLLSLTYTI